MTLPKLQFDAISESRPGAKWTARWLRSGPAYTAWFERHGGMDGPCRDEGIAALNAYMPELVPVHRRLTELAGGHDLASRLLTSWCPPPYLAGCTVLARAEAGRVRLIRNYDLSPDLNEGLLLRTEWTGTAVMGMAEFLWGLSDGVNQHGLSVALAYGGSRDVREGFGITAIVRYLLEVCTTTDDALAVLQRVPSHMAYNLVLADRGGRTASVELTAGGGLSCLHPSIATNHQVAPTRGDARRAPTPNLTRTLERRRHAAHLLTPQIDPSQLADQFLDDPLYQSDFDRGFGTLFTAVYDPGAGSLELRWPDHVWLQSLHRFEEGRRMVEYRQGVGARVIQHDRSHSATTGPCPTSPPRSEGSLFRNLGSLVAAYWPGIPDDVRAELDRTQVPAQVFTDAASPLCAKGAGR